MNTKETFKAYLLKTFDIFVDNTALYEYVDFILTYPTPCFGYSEKHHAIPVSCYKNLHGCSTRRKALKYANDDANNFQISLLYKDHCKAHYLLYFCTTGTAKQANAEALKYMFSVYPALTKPQKSQKLFSYEESDFELLQLYMDDLKEDQNSRFWKSYEIEFLKSNMRLMEYNTALID